MSNNLQSDRNASVDLNQMEHQAMEAMKADNAAPTSKFGGPGSSPAPSGDGAAFAEMTGHAVLMTVAPAAAMAAMVVSAGWHAHQSLKAGKKNDKSTFPGVSAPAATAAAKPTITPGLVTGGKATFKASPQLNARQAGGAMAASIFTTRQSMFSLNDNKTTKGLQVQPPKNNLPAAQKPMPTAQHLGNLWAIRREKAQGPKIIADARIQSHDVYTAAARGNGIVLDNLGDHAPDAKALPQQPSPPKA